MPMGRKGLTVLMNETSNHGGGETYEMLLVTRG